MTRAEKRALKNQIRNDIKEFLKIQAHYFPDIFLYVTYIYKVLILYLYSDFPEVMCYDKLLYKT